jgi:hypothetical protein
MRQLFRRISLLWLFIGCAASAFATSNYEYQPGEFVTIANGESPDGRYAIATHGEGDLGYDNWHVYLMDAQSGKKLVLSKRSPIRWTRQQRPMRRSGHRIPARWQ